MKAAVIGGGLAGCAAALELVDAGHDVTLFEARPTLGGAVQTLPEREGDPAPPPDNGQHIALGCFTEYLAFLERIGESGSVRRMRLSLPVVDEERRWAQISPATILLARYGHLPLRDRPLAWQLLALRGARADEHDDETFADFLLGKGQSPPAIERFWDVFIRPALNLPCAEASAAMGIFTVQTALLSGLRAGELVLPTKPLGWMHGDAALRTLERRGAQVETGVRVDDVDDVAADAIVVATPPAESARLLGEPEPKLEPSPIVSVHLLFDRPLLRTPLAALLDSDAHWLFDRGASLDRRAICRERRAISDRGLERRAGADGGARPRARRADRGAGDRTAGPRRAALVAGQPRAERDRRASPRDRGAASRPADGTSPCDARGRVDRDGLARDDGERGSLRPHGREACCPM